MAEQIEDVKSLENFLDMVREELRVIVEERLNEMPQELREDTEKAWKEVRGLIDIAQKKLYGIRSERLKEAGLTGSSLRLKLKGFMLARADGVRRRILRWMNIILGSLCTVLPILEPVKEFKEAVEESLSGK
jgi:hypothetical protein